MSILFVPDNLEVTAQEFIKAIKAIKPIATQNFTIGVDTKSPDEPKVKPHLIQDEKHASAIIAQQAKEIGELIAIRFKQGKENERLRDEVEAKSMDLIGKIGLLEKAKRDNAELRDALEVARRDQTELRAIKSTDTFQRVEQLTVERDAAMRDRDEWKLSCANIEEKFQLALKERDQLKAQYLWATQQHEENVGAYKAEVNSHQRTNDLLKQMRLSKEAAERAHSMLLDAGRWIPVSERMSTEADGVVLCCGKGGLIGTRTWGEPFPHETNWTRIPALPKEESANKPIARVKIDGKWLDVRHADEVIGCTFQAAEIFGMCPKDQAATIRNAIAPVALAQDPHGRPLHNPDQLSAEQVGEGYRLLLPEEVDGRHSAAGNGQMWIREGWNISGAYGNNPTRTYRVPISAPWPEKAKERWELLAVGESANVGDQYFGLVRHDWIGVDHKYVITAETAPVRRKLPA